MGETRVTFRIYGPKGFVDLEALADTGVNFTKIPESVAKRLGLEAEEEIYVRLSDGSNRPRGLTEAKVELNGVRRTVPLAIGPDEEEPLLGYTMLEILRFKVNLVTKKLERTVPIEYYFQSDQ